jgi:hypothetical protein
MFLLPFLFTLSKIYISLLTEERDPCGVQPLSSPQGADNKTYCNGKLRI